MERDPEIFSRNLDRMMTERLLRNADLARAIGRTRQMVSEYRQGTAVPADDETVVLMARRLGCRPTDLFDENGGESPPMLPIGQWAQREGIPVSRARHLFELGLLTGDVGGESGGIHLVPVELRAPRDSKRLVRISRRPAWVRAFQVNIDVRMAELKMRNIEMADHTGLHQSAVVNWRSGRAFPKEERLPRIAEKLGWTVAQLVAEPEANALARWSLKNAARCVVGDEFPNKCHSAADRQQAVVE